MPTYLVWVSPYSIASAYQSDMVMYGSRLSTSALVSRISNDPPDPRPTPVPCSGAPRIAYRPLLSAGALVSMSELPPTQPPAWQAPDRTTTSTPASKLAKAFTIDGDVAHALDEDELPDYLRYAAVFNGAVIFNVAASSGYLAK